MGFCIFNNVGFAAAYALENKGIERVAIIEISTCIMATVRRTCSSPPLVRDRVQMESFFQHPFYPYSGKRCQSAPLS